MSLFTKPPMFPVGKITPKRNPPRVSIEGKWQHIGKWVKELAETGWTATQPPTGEPSEFKMTSAEFTR